MNSTKLPHIALFAPAFSGKTTAAKHLVDEHGYSRFAFASEVRYFGLKMLNAVAADLDREPFTLEEVDRNKTVFRPFWQWLGTDFVREYLIKPEFWIDQFRKRAEATDGPVVVDDLRFPNEARALVQMGFEFVYVEADESFRFDNFLAATTTPVQDVAAKWEAANAHPSERHYPEIQRIAKDAGHLYTVTNTHDFDAFFGQVDNALLYMTYEAAAR